MSTANEIHKLFQRLKPLYHQDNFTAIFYDSTLNLTNEQRHQLERELSASEPASNQIIDLTALTKQPTVCCTYLGVHHQLDNYAKELFNRYLTENSGRYTLECEQALEQYRDNLCKYGEQQRPDFHAFTSTKYIHRTEARVLLITTIDIELDNEQLQAKTSDISLSGLKIKLPAHVDIQPNATVRVRFSHLKHNYQNRVLSSPIEYVVKHIYLKQDNLFVGLKMKHKHDEIRSILSDMLNRSRHLHRCNIKALYRNTLQKLTEYNALNASNGFHLFLSQTLQPCYELQTHASKTLSHTFEQQCNITTEKLISTAQYQAMANGIRGADTLYLMMLPSGQYHCLSAAQLKERGIKQVAFNEAITQGKMWVLKAQLELINKDYLFDSMREELQEQYNAGYQFPELAYYCRVSLLHNEPKKYDHWLDEHSIPAYPIKVEANSLTERTFHKVNAVQSTIAVPTFYKINAKLELTIGNKTYLAKIKQLNSRTIEVKLTKPLPNNPGINRALVCFNKLALNFTDCKKSPPNCRYLIQKISNDREQVTLKVPNNRSGVAHQAERYIQHLLKHHREQFKIKLEPKQQYQHLSELLRHIAIMHAHQYYLLINYHQGKTAPFSALHPWQTQGIWHRLNLANIDNFRHFNDILLKLLAKMQQQKVQQIEILIAPQNHDAPFSWRIKTSMDLHDQILWMKHHKGCFAVSVNATPIQCDIPSHLMEKIALLRRQSKHYCAELLKSCQSWQLLLTVNDISQETLQRFNPAGIPYRR